MVQNILTAGIFILFEAEEIVAVVLVIQQLVLIIVMSRFGEAALRKMIGGKPISLIVKVVVSKKLKSFVALGSSCLSGSTMNRMSCK